MNSYETRPVCAWCSNAATDSLVEPEDMTYKDGRVWHSRCWDIAKNSIRGREVLTFKRYLKDRNM